MLTVFHRLPIVFPLGIEVCVVFWGIWAIDRELVLPSDNDDYFPAYINHLWHTFPLILRIVEGLFVKRMKPPKKTQALVLSLFIGSYITRILYYHSWSGRWPYDIMKVVWNKGLSYFFAFCMVLYLLLWSFNRLGDKITEEKLKKKIH